MGKSLGAILTVGAAIAVNVIPGVGQAISAAIGSAALGVGLSVNAAYALYTAASVLPAVITTAGLQAGAGLLGLGPAAQKPDTSETAIKTARPPRVSGYGTSRLYGAYIAYETAEDGTAVDVYAVHDGELTEVVQNYLSDDRVTVTSGFAQEGDDGRYAGNAVQVYSTTGESPGTPIAAVVAKIPTIWTDDHRGDGVVIMAVLSKAVKSDKYLDIYPNGPPVGSMAAKWQKCPDPHAADPTDTSGWTWTENPIRQLMHYKLVREGLDYATKIAPTIAYWQTAADVCDEPIPLKAGGTEPRWRSCLSHKHTDRHASVVSGLLQCCDGWIAPRSDGALVVYAGKYLTPDVTIGPADIVSYEWQGVGVDDDSAVNELIVSYVSAEHDYNTVETDAWRDEDDIAERGEILSDSIDLQVPSHSQARRLAKRQMARGNSLHRGTIITNLGGRKVRGHRFINLRIVEAGVTFFDGVAEISAVTRNMSTGGVTFSWVAADPNVDAWNPATEEGDPAPVGNRIAPQPLDTPTIASAYADFSDIGQSDDLGGSSVKGVRVQIVAVGPVRDDLTWYSRWRVGSGAWSERQTSDADPGPGVSLVTDYVPYGATVTVEVAYGTGDGRTSPWSLPTDVDTSP